MRSVDAMLGRSVSFVAALRMRPRTTQRAAERVQAIERFVSLGTPNKEKAPAAAPGAQSVLGRPSAAAPEGTPRRLAFTTNRELWLCGPATTSELSSLAYLPSRPRLASDLVGVDSLYDRFPVESSSSVK